MNKFVAIALLLLYCQTHSFGQTYTLWSIGSPNDTITQPTPCTLLMGGATEDDQAMTRFLQNADHGDIVVIRTSGSDGYNNYLYTDLGVQVNSVQTLLVNSVAAANDSFVVQTVRDAEALWIAGGDQWTYITNWKNTPLNTAINFLVNVRHVPIGGTSAGMAILGEYYNSAQGGSALSSTVMANPYHSTVTIGSSDFVHNPLLEKTITDTHFDNPDRRGRLMTFIARTLTDSNVKINGIACDEYTSVFIDTNFKATVYGGGPTYDDNAYFVRIDCSGNNAIETCSSGMSLNWKQDSTVVKVYKIQSDSSGNQFFDLRNFGPTPTYTNQGGSWLNWWVSNGTLNTNSSASIVCSSPTFIDNSSPFNFNVNLHPNPFTSDFKYSFDLNQAEQFRFSVTDLTGKILLDSKTYKHYGQGYHCVEVLMNYSLPQGIYLFKIQSISGLYSCQKVTKE